MPKAKKTNTKKKKLKYDRDYRFEERVERVIDLLRKTNVCTLDNMMKYSTHMNKKISKSRLDALVKLKYIKQVKVINKKTKEVHIAYQLADRGRTYCKDFLKSSVYASRSTFHDLHQSNYLFKNFEISEIETYKHEKELTPPTGVDIHISIQQNISRPDGEITLNSGETVFVETLTQDYTQKRIKAKVRYAEYHSQRCLYNIL